MPLVRVNLSPVMAAIVKAAPRKADKKEILTQLAAAAMQYWKKLAQNGLRSSSRDYVNGLQLNDGDPVVIELVGRIPNMVENGWKGGDLRQWLLKGPNVKQGKNGPYNTVPFRHGVPGTTERNVGTQMPEAIYPYAQKLSPTLTDPMGKATRWGGRLMPHAKMKAEAQRYLTQLSKPWHAVSIYRGMVRQAKKFPGGMQTTGYTTFRRISLHSRGPKHWFHPGIKPRSFAPQVRKHVEQIAEQIITGLIGK